MSTASKTHAAGPGATISATTRVYTCDELGACQMRTPRCAGCSAESAKHHYPQPTDKATDKAYTFAPGVIDFGARRAHLEWRMARRAHAAWTFLRTLVIAGSITFTVALLAAKWGWL